jgi:hypothetical protein
MSKNTEKDYQKMLESGNRSARRFAQKQLKKNNKKK